MSDQPTITEPQAPPLPGTPDTLPAPGPADVPQPEPQPAEQPAEQPDQDTAGTPQQPDEWTITDDVPADAPDETEQVGQP
jgi:hypothetical protein